MQIMPNRRHEALRLRRKVLSRKRILGQRQTAKDP